MGKPAVPKPVLKTPGDNSYTATKGIRSTFFTALSSARHTPAGERPTNYRQACLPRLETEDSDLIYGRYPVLSALRTSGVSTASDYYTSPL